MAITVITDPLSPDLLDTLPATWRLAVAYAPKRVRHRWLTLLALDARLMGVVRPVRIEGREPIMAQLRLAWWRDRLREPHAQWPKGEPLLAALACWGDEHGVLGALVDGWEALLGEEPLGTAALEQWIEGRVAACVALASGDTVARMARGWALGDLLSFPCHPDEDAILTAQASVQDWRQSALPRDMRPLAVLHGLAARQIRDQPLNTIGALATTIRLGIVGR